MTLTVIAANAGPNASMTTVVSIDLGPGLGFDSAASTQGSCTETSGIVACAIGAIAASQQVSMTIDATAIAAGTADVAATIGDADALDLQSMTTTPKPRPLRYNL